MAVHIIDPGGGRDIKTPMNADERR